jgi:hypothetical protein
MGDPFFSASITSYLRLYPQIVPEIIGHAVIIHPPGAPGKLIVCVIEAADSFSVRR